MMERHFRIFVPSASPITSMKFTSATKALMMHALTLRLLTDITTCVKSIADFRTVTRDFCKDVIEINFKIGCPLDHVLFYFQYVGIRGSSYIILFNLMMLRSPDHLSRPLVVK